MLSADAFSAFEEAGLENKSAIAETGRRFRDTVLSLGGGRAPALVFKVLSLHCFWLPLVTAVLARLESRPSACNSSTVP